MGLREARRLGRDDLRAGRGEDEELVVGEAPQRAGVRVEAGVAVVDGVDVGDDVAGRSAERRRDGDGARVGAAPPQRGGFAVAPARPGTR